MKQFLVAAAFALAAAKAPAQITNATAQASSPEVAIVAPTNNHTIRLGGFIDVQARAVDRDDGISRLEILDGTTVIAASNFVSIPGETRSINFRWTPTNVLSRLVYARAADSAGLVATSAPVRVAVDHPSDRVYFAARYWTGDGFAWGEYDENGPVGSEVLFQGDPVVQRGPYYYGANKSGGHIFYRIHAEYDTLADLPADGQSPEVSWPRDVAYDSTRDRVLGVTLAGEGHLYELSPTSSHSIASMANRDVDSMVYHKPNDRLYMVENWHDDNHLNVLRFTPQGVLEGSETIAIRDIPLQVGSWYRSRLVSGGELIALLIEPTPGWSQTAPIESRMYIINPKTKAVTLAYRQVWEQWPPNAGSNPPTITIVEPGPNAALNPEKIVPVIVEASDPDNDLQKIEIFVAGVLVDEFVYVHSPTGATRQTALWRPSKPGTYALLARATDRRGNTFETRLQVNLTQEAAVIATRDLPPNYIPGLSFQVSITASPNAATDAWAVEEAPPLGWQIGAISHGGFFDGATKKIKWGPFTEQASLTITYFITPPANLVGLQTFSGNTSANGISRLIEGDKQITNGPIYHPADAPPEDNRLTLNEVTAYAAAWRTGAPWPRGHVRGIVPVAYVTRAGMIWKNGETYVHLPNIEPPACWAPTNQRTRRLDG